MEDKYTNLELYVVQNLEGKFFRAKGYGGYGDTWVDDINKAKIYTKIGQARSRVTWFSGNYPKYGIPLIVKLTIGSHLVINEDERVNKAIKSKAKKEVLREKAESLRVFKLAEADFKRASERLKKLS